METMKVYIKPWVEALKEAKKHKGLVDFFPDRALILGVSRRTGDWGHVRTVTKNSDGVRTSYTVIRPRFNDTGFIYDECCVEEITPEWLEKNAEVFSEKEIIIPSDNWCNDKHRIVIYKHGDHLNTFFFYVEWFYLDSGDESLRGWQVEKFVEIK